MKKIIKLIISIFICQAAGAIGSFFTANSIATWYTTLEKPAFNPPNWIFGPVWIFLYFLMGIALFLIWQQDLMPKRKAVIFFFIQLALNALWSILFFGLKSPGLAFLEIVILWIAILFNIFQFSRISKMAAYLLIPYIFWVSFAAILNFSIWRLN